MTQSALRIYSAMNFIKLIRIIGNQNTGRFIMYFGITKIYYRKTIGQVFTKPVQIEGTNQNFFPSELFFIVVHISVARR